jgi:hypothetical protein
MSVAHPGLRPDRCGVVFEKVADAFFLGTAVESFQMTSILRRQIASFVGQGYSVVIQTPYGTRPTAWYAEGQSEETIRKIAETELSHGDIRN